MWRPSFALAEVRLVWRRNESLTSVNPLAHIYVRPSVPSSKFFQVQLRDSEVPRPVLPAATPPSRDVGHGSRSRPSEVVGRGSRSPSREGGGKGPRPTVSPHPSVGPRRAGKFSKSKSEVGGRGSRSPSREGGGKGPRLTDSPHPSVGPRRRSQVSRPLLAWIRNTR